VALGERGPVPEAVLVVCLVEEALGEPVGEVVAVA
jgi:hypothetical protein